MKLKFGGLKPGDGFTYNGTREIFLKTEPAYDRGEGSINCVSLRTGEYSFVSESKTVDMKIIKKYYLED